MHRQVLQLHINRQAEQPAADAEEQSDHQKGMSVHAEKTHGRQIRQHQIGFATAACAFRLGVSECGGECGKQQAQEGRHGLVPALEKRLGAFLDGSGDLVHIRSPAIGADDLARKQKSHKERKHAHAQKKVDKILYSHMSSQT